MIERLLDALYPRRCPICRKPVMPKDALVCPPCGNGLPYIEGPFCFRCGKHVDSSEIEYCYECSGKALTFSSGRAVFEYTGAVRQAVLDFKYNGYRDNSDFFVRQMAERLGAYIEDMAPDILVPVPVHPSRKRFRGYNQAEILARELADYTGIPAETELLLRNRRTLPQKQLNFEQRSRNLSRAFSVDESRFDELKRSYCKDGIDIMLIDDIYTTGSTVEACSRALKASGAGNITFAAVCIGSGIA